MELINKGNMMPSSKFKMVLILSASISLLLGCATTKEMDVLKEKLEKLEGDRIEKNKEDKKSELYRKELSQQFSAEVLAAINQQAKRNESYRQLMSQRFNAFEENYSPAVRAQLLKNLAVAKSDREKIKELRRQSEVRTKRMAQLLNAGKVSLASIEKNQRSATTKNITNEFKALKAGWNSTLASAERQAEQSSDAARSARRSASYAEEHSRKTMNNSDQIKQNVEAALNEVQWIRNKWGDIWRSHDSLANRVYGNEKYIGSLPNYLRDINSKIKWNSDSAQRNEEAGQNNARSISQLYNRK